MSFDTALVARSAANSRSEDSSSRVLPCRATPGAGCFVGQSQVEAGAFNFVYDNLRQITRSIASMRAVAVSSGTGKRSIVGPIDLNGTIRCYQVGQHVQCAAAMSCFQVSLETSPHSCSDSSACRRVGSAKRSSSRNAWGVGIPRSYEKYRSKLR
jgi:hypothetical protein